jgi:hypothetical protein
MPHKGSELYFETVWAALSEGLKKRILAAVKKSIEARTPDNSDTEVVITALSDEHRKEVDWLIADEDNGKDRVFVLTPGGSGGNPRPGIKLSNGMVAYLEHHVVAS